MMKNPRRPLRLQLAGLLLILASPYGGTEATAGLMTYTWGPLVGSGEYITEPGGQHIDFQTSDGRLTIGYDPDDLGRSYIDVSTGSPGYVATAVETFTVATSSAGLTFTAGYLDGGSITATVAGDPGPLDARGDPLSLQSLLGDAASVGVAPACHGDELAFSGQTPPSPMTGLAVLEPSSLLLAALGAVASGLASAIRPSAKRPRPRSRAGRRPAAPHPGPSA